MFLQNRISWLLLWSFSFAAWIPAQQGPVSGDDGAPVSAQRHVGVPRQGPGALTTLFASDNRFAGNMFDLIPMRDLELTGLDLNVSGSTPFEIELWFRLGSSQGVEGQAAAWLYFGRYPGMSAGIDQPSYVDLKGNGITFLQGQVYGLYVDLISYERNTQVLRYTNGSGQYFNADLQLITHCGKGTPAFTGPTYPDRQWNGTVYYKEVPGFELGTLQPGIAGVENSIQWSGATPMGQVALLYATAPGATVLNQSCQGLQVDLANPILSGIYPNDGVGFGGASQYFPASASGRMLYFQAVDLSTCTVGNLVQNSLP